jgi:hypothetical protein
VPTSPNTWSDWKAALRSSPQQIDPLSWFTRPWVGVFFAGVSLLYGLAGVAINWSLTPQPFLEVVAVLLLASACLVIHFSTRPLGPLFTLRSAVLPLVLAAAGLLTGTIGIWGSRVPVELWWIPIGVGLAIATCAPYSTAFQIGVYGLIFSIATGIAVWLAFTGNSGVWSPFSEITKAVTAIIVATVASAVFSFVVVRNTRVMLTRATANAESLGPDEDLGAEELTALARVGLRVAPFLNAIADAGEVTESDRTLAGQLARRLRTDLVVQANRTWLDTLALKLRMFVVDPDHRANNMNVAQQTALRGLLTQVQKDPAIDMGTLFIEFRAQEDGSTGVALSLDLDLPEGRRIMLIAPYYLALKTTVRDLTWDPLHDLVQFRLPAKGE